MEWTYLRLRSAMEDYGGALGWNSSHTQSLLGLCCPLLVTSVHGWDVWEGLRGYGKSPSYTARLGKRLWIRGGCHKLGEEYGRTFLLHLGILITSLQIHYNFKRHRIDSSFSPFCDKCPDQQLESFFPNDVRMWKG